MRARKSIKWLTEDPWQAVEDCKEEARSNRLHAIHDRVRDVKWDTGKKRQDSKKE